MNSISAKNLKEILSDKGKDIVVIDVRSKEEWESGHIEDSRVKNIEVGSIMGQADSLDKSKDTYLICESGGRSSFANVILSMKGFKSFDVEGGMSAFRKL
jgi:rhodanese-related sulfurtransferase